jgi:hypothetical protein
MRKTRLTLTALTAAGITGTTAGLVGIGEPSLLFPAAVLLGIVGLHHHRPAHRKATP